MPGTGPDDIAGVIPYRAVPQVYNPPGRVVVTANQRPVEAAYPYYIGTSANDFDAGYRAATELAYLRGHRSLRPASFAALQGSLRDGLARQVVAAAAGGAAARPADAGAAAGPAAAGRAGMTR